MRIPFAVKHCMAGGVLAAGVLAATIVQAQPYVGAQAGMMKIDRGQVSDATLTGLTLRGGLVLHELLSAEVRVGKAVGDDSYRNVDVENDFYYGAYARLTPPLAGPVQPYLIGGYSYVENDFNGNTLRDDGESYGGGFDLGMEEHLSMNLEYLRLVDNDFGTQELIGVGVNYAF
ncbi:MAG: porin family protein [Pseudomonadales bacterium]|nr:porin family protein [Pseudomonadales bacterium]